MPLYMLPLRGSLRHKLRRRHTTGNPKDNIASIVVFAGPLLGGTCQSNFLSLPFFNGTQYLLNWGAVQGGSGLMRLHLGGQYLKRGTQSHTFKPAI